MGVNKTYAILDKAFAFIGTSPVSLNDAKAHLNMLFETDGSYEFDDDDDYIGQLIEECTAALESYTGTSIRERTVVVIFEYHRGKFTLPYGPVSTPAGAIQVLDKDGVAIDNCYIRGLANKYFDGPCIPYGQIQYSAGYGEVFPNCPDDLLRAIKEEVAYRYNNRGAEGRQYAAEEPGVSEGARKLAAPYRRGVWLL